MPSDHLDIVWKSISKWSTLGYSLEVNLVTDGNCLVGLKGLKESCNILYDMNVLEGNLQVTQNYDSLHLVLVVILIGDIVYSIRQVWDKPIREAVTI